MPTLIYISLNSCEIQHLFIYLFICHLDFCFHELIVYIIYSVAYPILLLILSVFYIVIMPILSFILLQVSSTCLWLFFFFSRLILLLTLCLRKKVCCPVDYSNWKGKSNNVCLSLFCT